MCRPGESGVAGVPLFDDTTPNGPPSGGSDTCVSDGAASFQAATEVLSTYGVTVH